MSLTQLARSESGLVVRGLRGVDSVDRSRALITREPSVLNPPHWLLHGWLGMYRGSLLLLFILLKNKIF